MTASGTHAWGQGDGDDSGNSLPLWQRRLFEQRRLEKPQGEVSYAFYPGTGLNDLLEFNIVNAPVVPLWRTRTMKHRGNEKVVAVHLCCSAVGGGFLLLLLSW